MSPELALQGAIKAILQADAGVSAKIGRLYDEVPADRAPATTPYAYVGAVNRKRREESGRVWTVTMRLFVVTDEFGRADAWSIAHAISAALDTGEEPELAPPFAAADALRVTQAGDVVEPGSEKSVFLDVQTTIQQLALA